MSERTLASEGAGVYSNKQILAAIEAGHIVCHPFVPEHVNTTSIDVTIGEHFFATDREATFGVYNPYDPKDVSEYFGEPQLARPFKEYKIARHLRLDELRGIDDDFPVILLGPGERILAHTHEFVGIRPPGTSSMQGRSTTGRNGISVCVDAGWGDAGYINRWTMEVANLNEYRHVPIPLGERIAQMVFYHTGEVEGEYATDTGKYQTTKGDDLASIIKRWKPEDMLPKAWKDTRKTPIPITDF